MVVPSLPGFAWSEDPAEALSVRGMSDRLLRLLGDGLGLDSFAVAGGDWGVTNFRTASTFAARQDGGTFVSLKRDSHSVTMGENSPDPLGTPAADVTMRLVTGTTISDRPLKTTYTPADLPDFCRALIAALAG